MTKKIQKSLALMALAFGLFFIAGATDAMAQRRCNTQRGYQSANYYQDDYYRDRRASRNRNYNYNDDYYYDRENTTGKAVGRTAIGAGIGAAGGYLYHRNKVNNQRDRYYRY